MKICVLVGTRPEIIKMSPVIRECRLLGLNYFVLHTGQHYSYNMDKVFFEQLELPAPKYNLEIGSGSHGRQTGEMLIEIEKALVKEEPDVVLVQGDTNTVLAGALAAYKLGVKVGHVEAGLRSYDRRMPEEINRVLADHCSDFLFTPTMESKLILLGEGIAEEKVFIAGNTVVDAVFQNFEISKGRTEVLPAFGLKPGQYFVATVHRQENVDDEKNFRGIVKGLEKVRIEFGYEVVYPVHPRALERLEEFGLAPEGVKLIEALDYSSFLQLEGNARLVLTDSGGVQEEACILRIPCVTMRDNTERPETLTVGANVLAGTKPDKIVECVKLMLARSNNWENPFGDGKAGQRIIEIVRREVE
jgi:UDP-N-acetylglucosamine 2-epimerase (non-hydrolysing)